MKQEIKNPLKIPRFFYLRATRTKFMKKTLQLLAAGLLLTLTTVNAGVPTLVQRYRMPVNVTSDDYIAKTIILKVKDQYRSACTNEQINIAAVQRILSAADQVSLGKIFPRHLKPARLTNEYEIGRAHV